MQYMDFRVFESALGSQRRFPPLSGHCNLETNIFHINYTIIFYPFLLNSCISCPDRPGIRETKTPLARVLYSRAQQSSWILGILNLHLEARQ